MTELQTENKVIGIRQSTRAVEEGEARLVFMARDCDDKVAEPFLALCARHELPVTYLDTMAELGAACGITVGAAVAVVLK